MSGEVIARLFVAGRARTKGSLKPIHIRGGKGRPCRVSLTEDHDLATPWKRTMIAALRHEVNLSNPLHVLDGPYAGPVEVHAFYRFERAHVIEDSMVTDAIWPSHDTLWPTSPDIGDEDKLRRNVLDALTQSGLLADDRLVVGGMNMKRWCVDGEEPGVLFLVHSARSPEDAAALEAGWTWQA